MAGCAPAAAPTSSNQAAAATSTPARTTPKILTIGSLREPYSIEGFVSGTVRDLAGEAGDLAQNHLTVLDPNETPQPQLAAELPSVENGTWQVHPDGTMDVTWKLRPGVTWHDGAPFTSDDLLFSLTVHKDPDLLYSARPDAALIASAAAPDPHTLIVHWSQTSVKALQGSGLEPMRRDLLEELYRSDKTSFANSSRFTTDFVGLGPYRMVAWERGSYMQLGRFDNYFLSRPPLDGVVIKFIKDGNTLVANLLAGAVDLVVPPSIEMDPALALKQQWAGTGNQVRIDATPRIGYVEIQLRPDTARPASVLLRPEIRQALYQAIDRASISQVVAAGLPPADSWYAPADPLRPSMEAMIPQYPYDPARARQLLGQAGWVPGTDQVRMSSASGERMSLESWIMVQGSDKAAAIVGDNWKQIGVETAVSPIAPANAGDRQYRAQFPGVLINTTSVPDLPDRFDSRDVAGPANRWGGRNTSGYTNPRVNEALDRLKTSVDPNQRLPYLQQVVHEVMADVGIMPLYWEPRPVIAAASVRADIHPNRVGWNAYTWDKAA
jgi:peptide/nickel transport system substrate-binding protein